MTLRAGPIDWRTAWLLASLAGRSGLLAAALFAVIQAVLPVAGLVAMQWLIDAVASGVAGRAPAADALHDATLATLLAAGVAVFGSAVRSAASVLGETHGRALADAAALRVQTHASRVELAEFDRPAFHDLLLRAGAEASQRPVRLVQDGIAVLVAGIALLTMAGLLARVAFWLPCLVVLLALPLAIVRRADARARVRWQEAHAGDQRDIGYAGAVLTGRATAKDVRVLGIAGFWAARLERLRSELRRTLKALAGRRGRAELLVQSLGSAGLFVAYYVLARSALAGDLTLGALVLQAQAAQRTQNGVRDLLAALAGVHEHRLFLRPVVELLLLPAATTATPPPRTPPPGPLALAVHELAFRYPEGAAEVLGDVTFAVAAGARIAIVGRNGSGKSTLLKLLARLYAPARGRVLASGESLAHVEPSHWIARTAVLLQDAALFELTLRENLVLGHCEPANDEQLWRALETVGLAARVRELPQGLETLCSRRHAGGVDWSVGEARRLLLARTLAQRADLVLLDEPFLALDGALANALGQHLAALPRDRTLVLADHRPQAIAWVDRVFVLEGGRVVASGTPAELRLHPAFAALFPS